MMDGVIVMDWKGRVILINDLVVVMLNVLCEMVLFDLVVFLLDFEEMYMFESLFVN